MAEEKTMKVVLNDLKPVDKKTQKTLDELYGSHHALAAGHSGTWWLGGGSWHHDIDAKF